MLIVCEVIRFFIRCFRPLFLSFRLSVFLFICLLSFCLTLFVTFSDYGYLSGGRGGETGLMFWRC